MRQSLEVKPPSTPLPNEYQIQLIIILVRMVYHYVFLGVTYFFKAIIMTTSETLSAKLKKIMNTPAYKEKAIKYKNEIEEEQKRYDTLRQEIDNIFSIIGNHPNRIIFTKGGLTREEVTERIAYRLHSVITRERQKAAKESLKLFFHKAQGVGGWIEMSGHTISDLYQEVIAEMFPKDDDGK